MIARECLAGQLVKRVCAALCKGISFRSGTLSGNVAAVFVGLILAMALPAHAQNEQQIWTNTGEEVDVALVLAVDISFSMDLDEQHLQREGYIAALTSKPVLDAIRNGLIGRIGVTYIEWAGVATRNVVADWHIIEDAASAEVVAKKLREAPIRRARRTSLTTAIDFSMDQLRAAKLKPIRRVIDISGDGPNNEGGPVARARDRALGAGVTTNGLPIILKRGGYGASFDIENLDAYFNDCIIGGPGSFMVVIKERAQFADAIRAKILREVAQSTMSDVSPMPVQKRGADCMIGERLWQQQWGN